MRNTSLVLSVVAMLWLTACSGSPEHAATAEVPITGSPTAATEEPAAPKVEFNVRPGPISLAVTTATIKGVQAQIVTLNGWTAYRFEGDVPNPPSVNCMYDCLLTWPAALTDGSPIEAIGIDRSLIGTVKRKDGLVQVTLAGWPLYRFKEDKSATDTRGEGVAGNWSVVRPNGKAVIRKG